MIANKIKTAQLARNCAGSVPVVCRHLHLLALNLRQGAHTFGLTHAYFCAYANIRKDYLNSLSQWHKAPGTDLPSPRKWHTFTNPEPYLNARNRMGVGTAHLRHTYGTVFCQLCRLYLIGYHLDNPADGTVGIVFHYVMAIYLRFMTQRSQAPLCPR